MTTELIEIARNMMKQHFNIARNVSGQSTYNFRRVARWQEKIKMSEKIIKLKLDDGREIETHFSFYGGGVLSKMTWNGFQAVNEDELTGLQVHEGGCFQNSIQPKVGETWASIYCGQAGSVYVPFSEVRSEKECEVQKRKIVWIGKYPNEFGYEKNIVVMEMDGDN